MVLFPYFAALCVCVYTQFYSGSYSDLWLPVNWWVKSYCFIMKLMDYLSQINQAKHFFDAFTGMMSDRHVCISKVVKVSSIHEFII